jgi:hypothetical protein
MGFKRIGDDTTIEIEIEEFPEINKRFKKVSLGPLMQTMEFQRDIVTRFEIDTGEHSKSTGLMKIFVDMIDNKLLHLSYTYPLWDLCLCWETKPILVSRIVTLVYTSSYRGYGKFIIYRETKRNEKS